MNIAIVGATGNVGRKILEVLEKKELAIDNLYLLASSRSAGSKINFNGNEYEVDVRWFFARVPRQVRGMLPYIIDAFKQKI